MNNSILATSPSENTKRAEKYICKYLNELKIHFNLSDQQTIRILNSISQKLKKKSKGQAWWNVFNKSKN